MYQCTMGQNTLQSKKTSGFSSFTPCQIIIMASSWLVWVYNVCCEAGVTLAGRNMTEGDSLFTNNGSIKEMGLQQAAERREVAEVAFHATSATPQSQSQPTRLGQARPFLSNSMSAKWIFNNYHWQKEIERLIATWSKIKFIQVKVEMVTTKSWESADWVGMGWAIILCKHHYRFVQLAANIYTRQLTVVLSSSVYWVKLNIAPPSCNVSCS